MVLLIRLFFTLSILGVLILKSYTWRRLGVRGRFLALGIWSAAAAFISWRWVRRDDPLVSSCLAVFVYLCMVFKFSLGSPSFSCLALVLRLRFHFEIRMNFEIDINWTAFNICNGLRIAILRALINNLSPYLLNHFGIFLSFFCFFCICFHIYSLSRLIFLLIQISLFIFIAFL